MKNPECDFCLGVLGVCTECDGCFGEHCQCDPCAHGRARAEECVACGRGFTPKDAEEPKSDSPSPIVNWWID
jgi:hypothetical protein